MPSLFVPRRSGVHRIAGIALLRALLSQCRLQAQGCHELQNIVRNRFRANLNLQSPRLLTSAFKAGNEALDILTLSAGGDEASRSKLQNLFPHIPAHLKRPSPRPALPAKKHTEAAADPHDTKASKVEKNIAEKSFASRHAILQRPREEVTGKRHIPAWTRAHGIPFLRIKKPQPPALSGYISSRVKRRQRWIDLRVKLYNTIVPLGEAEDEWDDIIDQESDGKGVIDRGTGAIERQTSWAQIYRDAAIGCTLKFQEEGRGSALLSQEMLEVVNRERDLAKKEQRRAKKARKYARRQGIEPTDEQALRPNVAAENEADGGM